MAYHEEDEVSRLVMNYVMWAGEHPIRSCGNLFDEDKINLRELRQAWRSYYRMEALGADAAITKETLEAMTPVYRFAIWTFHLSSLTFEMQAKTIIGVSKSTYHGRLERGHIEFMEQHLQQKDIARERAASYARMLNQG